MNVDVSTQVVIEQTADKVASYSANPELGEFRSVDIQASAHSTHRDHFVHSIVITWTTAS